MLSCLRKFILYHNPIFRLSLVTFPLHEESNLVTFRSTAFRQVNISNQLREPRLEKAYDIKDWIILKTTRQKPLHVLAW